jgi:ATP-dependent DNA ligase
MTILEQRIWLPHEIHPQRFEWVEQGECWPLITNLDWVAEQKLDGQRLQVRITAEHGVHFIASNGKASASTAISKWLPGLKETFLPLSLGTPMVFDGEIMPETGDYYVFDLPLVGGRIVPTDPFAVRREVLEGFFAAWPEANRPKVHLIRQVRSELDKARLLKEVDANGGEGLMFKRLDSPYTPGGTVTHSLKVKFYKTVDAIVTARNVRSTASAELAVWEDGKLLPVGACSMLGKPDAQVGDVAEVRYLYASPKMLKDGRSTLILYQPNFERIRTDKAAHECRLAQLTPVNKGIL